MLGKDIDPIILNNLDDKDLISYCRVNKEANRLCKDQGFWRNRLGIKFPFVDMEIMDKIKPASWSDVYIFLSQYVKPAFRPNNIDHHLMFYAAANNILDFIKYGYESGLIKDQAVKDLLLWAASQNGRLDVVKYLVEIGADVHTRIVGGIDDKAVIDAYNKGHYDVVDYLVSQGSPDPR